MLRRLGEDIQAVGVQPATPTIEYHQLRAAFVCHTKTGARHVLTLALLQIHQDREQDYV